MWHEARKQEKLLRTMMVDYRRRAERRRDYYEKTKGDPAQFLQLHGRPCKIHLDPSIAAAADSPATMMPWPGDPSVIIDRFDVRAHLDYIAPRRKEDSDSDSSKSDSSLDSAKEDYEERYANYECYRILVQNEFLGVSEEKFLHQIAIEEQFGPVQKTGEEDKKKQLAPKKAAIGFTYDDSTPAASAAVSGALPPEATEEEESDSDVDLDLSVKVDKLSTDQMREINAAAQKFGLGKHDFMNLLTRDLDQQEALRVQKEEEQERALYSGRKRRKERRAFRQRKLQALLQTRNLSPPSYASRPSPTYDEYRRSKSASKSRSGSPQQERITFITSFGGDDSDTERKKVATARKEKHSDTTKRTASRRSRSPFPVRSRRRSSERSRPRRSRSRTRHHRRSRSRSRSRSGRSQRRRSRSRSRSRSRTRHGTHRRSRSRSRSRSKSRSRRSGSRSRHSASRSRRARTSSASRSPVASAKPSAGSAASQPETLPLPTPPVRQYYGRKKSDNESSSTSEDELERNSKNPLPAKSNPAASASTASVGSATKVRKTDSAGKTEAKDAGRLKQAIQGG